MSLPELERLLWEREDGALTAENRARLELLLEREPDAQRLEQEIAGLARELDTVEVTPAPAGLAAEIRSSIRAAASTAPTAASPAPRGSALGRLLRPPAVRRMAYLAAALALAVVSYLLIVQQQTTGIDTGTFTGTAGLTETESTAPAVTAEPGRRGALTVSRRDAEVVVVVELFDPLGSAVLEIRGSGLELLRAAAENTGAVVPRRVDGGLEIDLGGGRLEVAIAPPAGELALAIRSGDQVLVSRRLQPAEWTETEQRTNF